MKKLSRRTLNLIGPTARQPEQVRHHHVGQRFRRCQDFRIIWRVEEETASDGLPQRLLVVAGGTGHDYEANARKPVEGGLDVRLRPAHVDGQIGG
jgi:hypothetical protein